VGRVDGGFVAADLLRAHLRRGTTAPPVVAIKGRSDYVRSCRLGETKWMIGDVDATGIGHRRHLDAAQRGAVTSVRDFCRR
jgi:hypothetical protein